MNVRTIYVSGGRADYVTATISEKDGEDLTTAVFRLGLSPSSTQPPTEWHPCEVKHLEPGKAELRMLVDSSIGTPGDWWLWADLVDNPVSQPVIAEGRITLT